VLAAPDLAVVKSDSGTTAVAGGTVVYTLTYTNTGTQDATGVVLTETVPSNAVFSAAGSTPGWAAMGGGVYVLTIGDLAVGQTGTAQFAVQIAASLPAGVEAIVNTAAIADDGSNGPDLNPADNSSTDQTPVIAAPDLSVVKSDQGTTVAAGAAVVYTLTYTNTGTQNATGVVLTEAVPVHATYSSAGSTPGWVDLGGGQYAFNLGNLAVGQTGSVQFAVTVNNPLPAGVAEIANTALIADDGSNGPDENPADNSSTDSTPVMAAPNLAVTKTDGAMVSEAGGVVVYTLNYTNTGSQGATGVVLTETLPPHTTFDSAGSTAGWTDLGGGQYAYSVGNLASGASGSVTFAVRIASSLPAGVEQIANTVLIADDGSNGPDEDPSDNTGTDTTPVTAAPDLFISKSHAGDTVAGGSVVYTLSYGNQGSQDATGVVITEELPQYSVYNAAGSTPGWVETSPGSGIFTFFVGNVAVGQTGSVLFAVTVSDSLPAGVTQLLNTVSIADDGTNGPDENPADNVDSDRTDVDAAPDLSLSKSDSGTVSAAGQVIVYTLSYANTGTQGATGVVISETLPANTVFDNAGSTAGWVETFPGSGVFEFELGAVPVGSSGSVQFAVRVNSSLPAGVVLIENTATIGDDGANGPDQNPLDNSDTDTTPVVAAPDLSVVKSDAGATVAAGGVVVYTLSYANTGTQDATGVYLEETLPSYATFSGAGSTPGWADMGGGVYRFPVGAVAVGQTGTVQFAVQVAASLPAGVGAIDNTALVGDDGSNGPDENPADNTSSDSTPVLAFPDLSVVKSDSGDTAVGGTVVYTLAYTNTGTQGATGVVLTETLPQYTAFDPDGSTPGWLSLGGGLYEFHAGTVEVGQAGSVQFAVIVAGSLPAGVEQLSNTATIGDDGTNGPDLNPGNNTSGNTTPVAAFPDLSVVKSDQGATVAAGAVVVYTLTYSNTGTQGATGVVLSEALPPHTVFAAGSSTPGWVETSPGSGLYTSSVGNVPVGATGTVQFAVQVAASLPAGVETIANTATIADDGSNGPDLNPNNNTSTDETPVIAAPDLSIVKTDSGVTATAGGLVLYTLTYTNTGTQGATGVVITETVPANATFESGSSTSGWIDIGGGQFAFNVGSVPVGATGSVTFAVRVAASLPAGVEEIVNSALIGDDGLNGADEDPSDNSATDATPVLAAPDLAVVKSDSGTTAVAGGTVVYTLTYTNTGTQDATGVVLTETVPSNAVFSAAGSTPGWAAMGGGVYVLTIGDLAVGQTGTAQFAVQIAASLPAGVEAIVNTAAIADDGSNGPDLNPDDNSSTDQTPVIAAPDLSVVKSDQGTTVAAGAVVVYTLTYTNTGTQNATGVVLTEAVPVHATYSSAGSTPGWVDLGGGQYAFNLGNLAVGQTGSVQFAVTVNNPLPAGVAEIANTAVIGDDGSNGPDENPADNSSTDSTPVIAAPNLAVTKTDGAMVSEAGGVVVYTLHYTNTGSQGATGVVLTETLPPHTTFDSAGSTAGWTDLGGGQYAYSVGNLASGASGSVTFAVRIASSLPAGIDQIANTVLISDDGSNGPDEDPSNNTGTDTTPVTAAPDLFISKSHAGDTVAGGSVVYTLSYGNQGSQDATGVVITEELPQYSVYNAAGSTAGWVETSPGSGIFTFFVGNVAVGQTGSVQFAVTVSSSLPAGVTQLLNTVSIADDGTNGPDENPADNVDSDRTDVDAAPDLSLSKSDSGTVSAAGQVIVYTLSYANTGSQDATGVVISETLPANTVFDNAGSTAGWVETFPGSGVFEFELGAVAVGGSGSVQFAVRVNSSLPAGVVLIENTATIGDDGSQRSGPEPAGQQRHGHDAGGGGAGPVGGQERCGRDGRGGRRGGLHVDVHQHGQPGRDGRVPGRDAAQLRDVQRRGQHAGLGGPGRRRVPLPGRRVGGGPDGHGAVRRAGGGQSAGGRGRDRQHGAGRRRRAERPGREPGGQRLERFDARAGLPGPVGGQDGQRRHGGRRDGGLHAGVHQHGYAGRDGRGAHRDLAAVHDVRPGRQHPGLVVAGRRACTSSMRARSRSARRAACSSRSSWRAACRRASSSCPTRPRSATTARTART
jgi:uncharacterized repeat protein (TIGR01451 family)